MKAGAEVARVWAREGRIQVVGHIHGGPAGNDGPWRLLLTVRGDAQRCVAVDAALEGESFDASVPVEDLVPGNLAEPVKWDLHLVSGTGPQGARLRVGRHLDDIRGKKKIMVFPAQHVAIGRQSVAVRPLYTIKDNLSIECHPGAGRPDSTVR